MWEYDLVPVGKTTINPRKLTAKRTINAAETYAMQKESGVESPLLVQLDSMGQFGLAEVFGKEKIFHLAEAMYKKGEKVLEDSKKVLAESEDVLGKSEALKKEYKPLIDDAAKYIRTKNDCVFKNKKYPEDKLFDYKTDTRFDENGEPVYKVIWSPSDYTVLRTKNENGSFLEIRGNKRGITSIERAKNNSARKRGDFEERYTFHSNGELEKYEEGYSKKNGNNGKNPDEAIEMTAKVFTFRDNKLNTFIAGKEIKDTRHAVDVNSNGVYLFDYSRDGNLLSAKIGQNNDSVTEEYYFEDGKPKEICLNRDGNKYDKIITYNKDGSIKEIKEECKYSYS